MTVTRNRTNDLSTTTTTAAQVMTTKTAGKPMRHGKPGPSITTRHDLTNDYENRHNQHEWPGRETLDATTQNN
jgi:hypothetical protein